MQRAAIESISAVGLVKRYGRQRALAGVDLELHRGSFCALLGANGAGKSTLMGVLSTLVRPSAGDIAYRVGGAPVQGAALRREIGMLAHEAFLYGQLTAAENLEFYGRLYDVPECDERAARLLDQVGLDKKARDRPASTFSRGMTQRLALARALLHEPSVLLLDEPFTGLDRVGAEALSTSLAAAKARGCLMLVVTHDLEAIAGLTDHVVVLRRGKVAHEETRGPETAGFSYTELKELYHRHSE